MTDTIHVEFQDVWIKFPLRLNSQWVTDAQLHEYFTWCSRNLKAGTYRTYSQYRMINLLKEDLAFFTLKFGRVYEITNGTEELSKIEKFLLTVKFNEKTS